MLSVILFILIILWLLGFLSVPLFNITLFSLGRNAITLNDILLFLVIIWLIDLLPYPFQQIALVLFLLWILSAIGIIAIAGFSQIVVIAIIIGLVAFIVSRRTVV